MTNARATLTPDHIGKTIRLRTRSVDATGPLVGIHAHGAIEQCVNGSVTVDYVGATAVLYVDGEEIQIPVARDTTMEVCS